jgi:hypothetical protein
MATLRAAVSATSPEARKRQARQRSSLMRRDSSDRIANKLHAVLWVIGAVLTLVYTQIVDVVIESPQVDR